MPAAVNDGGGQGMRCCLLGHVYSYRCPPPKCPPREPPLLLLELLPLLRVAPPENEREVERCTVDCERLPENERDGV